MSDQHDARPAELIASASEDSGDAGQPEIGKPISQAEIDDLVNDTQMPIEERTERLQSLARQLGVPETVDSGGEFDPLSAQVSEALSFLAQGGHVYGKTDATGPDFESERRCRSPDR